MLQKYLVPYRHLTNIHKYKKCKFPTRITNSPPQGRGTWTLVCVTKCTVVWGAVLLQCMWHAYHFWINILTLKVLNWPGPCKLRNETETERNKTDRNETKQIETKRNRSKRNETNRNKTKRNETNDMTGHCGQTSVFFNIRKSFSYITKSTNLLYF